MAKHIAILGQLWPGRIPFEFNEHKNKNLGRVRPRCFVGEMISQVSKGIKSICSHLASLRVVTADQDGKHACPIETGFRCDQSQVHQIEQVLEALVSNQVIADLKNIENSPLFNDTDSNSLSS